MSPSTGCPLCREPGGEPVWQDDTLRVILADEPDFPGFTRVVWQAHVAEMTDLPTDQRLRIMGVVFVVEQAMRTALRPDKVNLASLGNAVPHLHWHIVPRFADDARFPGSPWSAALVAAGVDAVTAQRRAGARRDALRARLPAYRAELAAALDAWRSASFALPSSIDPR